MSIKSNFKVTSDLELLNGDLTINGNSGTAGQILVSAGPNSNPVWEDNIVNNINNQNNLLFLCGYNSFGQLGDNTRVNKSYLVQTASGGNNWDSADCGQRITAAIKTDGTLWTWGIGGFLGDNTVINRSIPVQTVAGGTNWSSVSCGQNHTAAIKTDGSLWLWGENLYGQLGDGNAGVSKSSPVQTVTGGAIWNSAKWDKVNCGNSHTAAIKTDGSLWVFGSNIYGQLGLENTVDKYYPVQTICEGNNWKEISCGTQITAAIKTDGTLWLWGANNFGQLGDGTWSNTKSSPVQTICGGNNWSKVSCGIHHTAAIKTDGTLWVWGKNDYGQLGIGNFSDSYNFNDKSSPVQTISGGTNWSDISCGVFNTAAIKTDGSLWTWGRNDYGVLGYNNLISKSSPVQIVANGIHWKSVNIGCDYTMAAISY